MPVTKFTLTAPEIGYEKTITLNVEKPPQYIVHFRRPDNYEGEFGFDWMRKEYLPISEGGQGVCVEGLDELKKIYTPFKIDLNHKDTGKPYGDYYVPWLTMFPNHKDKIGKDVELLVTIPQEYNSDEFYTNTEEEFFYFEPNNSVLRIEPSKISVDEAVNGTKITIYCDAPLQEDSFIEVRSSKKALVGKLNVMKNAHHKDLTMNIYVIKSYLTDNPTYGKEIVDTKLTELGGLQVIEDYLNKKSLNQALIQVKLIEIDPTIGKPFDWGFRKVSLINAGRGLDPEFGNENAPTNIFYEQFKGMLVDENRMLVNDGKYVNFINLQFSKKYKNYATKKGLFLYLTSLNSHDSGGTAFLVPLSNKHCIIFNSNLKHLPSYAHEIGHTLGLPHTFPENDTNYDSKIETFKLNVSILEDWLSRNQGFIIQNPKHSMVKYYKESLEECKNIKMAYEKIKEYDIFRFNQSKTDNIMDYYNTRQSFTIWQIKIMQNEVKEYYH